ncbi:hypothetical protein AAF712_001550 [Marasmius tenuissimus]|uniref:Uncharacterized protein n=1 Tax=Marasmius tenuissimus TaxID=585030 RepID=A0ABR3AEK3_9AGAR
MNKRGSRMGGKNRETSSCNNSKIVRVKLFLVSPSEMCDEQTASRLTALSTAKRNRLSGIHIIQSAKLQLHWTHGLGKTSSKHQVHLEVPKEQKSTREIQYRQLPTPTLSDLLNPTPANEETLFNVSNPYSPDSLVDRDDEDDTSFLTIRSGRRLDIKDFIDLLNINLLNRYDGKAIQGPSPASEAIQSRKPGEEWKEEHYKADEFML